MVINATLPVQPSRSGLVLVCDENETWRGDPDLRKHFLVRRELVRHLLTLLVKLNEAYRKQYKQLFNLSLSDIGNPQLAELPENGIPKDLAIRYEAAKKKPPATLGDTFVPSGVIAFWFKAGGEQPSDFPIAARARRVLLEQHPSLDVDMNPVIRKMQLTKGGFPVNEMTTVAQMVTFLLGVSGTIFEGSSVQPSSLPKRPLNARVFEAKKGESSEQKKRRGELEANARQGLKKWDPVDQQLIDELSKSRVGHASISLSSIPAGFVEARSAEERTEEAMADIAEAHGVKYKEKDGGAVVLPQRIGNAVSESSEHLWSLESSEHLSFFLLPSSVRNT